ncbi:uncharacterized protein LOC141641494 [Silene latifolia]|uniref:uncharacterized protein LOC141641494 n=1 Tax=Silene latifolia TaxID=37657 RepID=UPI003D773A32
MAFKADMSKAYDRVGWNFIRGTLVLMRFPRNFIQLIMKCITTVSYEILVNGVPCRRIQPSCGLRQGGPLSPYIFVVCTGILSLNILRMEKDGLLRGIKVSRNNILISHMLFADDSMFFIEGNSKSCDNLNKVLKDYCHALGQVINDNKSSMTLSPCSSLSFARKCFKTFNIPCDTNMGTYLGIPTDAGLSRCNKSKREIFEFIIDKVRKRLSSWNCVLLSSAGRLALISSVLWCSRLFLSQPNGIGGLGIRRTLEFNQALLDKIGWRMITHPYSILSKFIGAEYGLKVQDGNLLFNDGRSNSSWGWKGSDNLFWSASSSGNYSVKIGYQIALKNSSNTSATRVPASDNVVVRCRKVFYNLECSPIGAILLYQDTLNLALSAEDRKPGSIVVQTPLEEDLTNLKNGVSVPLIQGSLSCSRSHIYVDAAWSTNLDAGFGGCIMLDNELGALFRIKGRAQNAEQAEALAIREGLKWELSRNILHINIFSDCLQVLAQILKYSQLKHWTSNTVDDIIELASNFHCIFFAYVPRICNKATHRLAKRAIKL